MNEQHIKEVLSDKVFVAELIKLETVEEAQKALKDKGVDISVEELNEVRDIFLANADENGELSLEALDDVAGGLKTITFLIIVGVLAVTVPPLVGWLSRLRR